MKKFTFHIILSFLFITFNLNAQDWESLDSGTGFILFDISFAPGQSEIGFAGGMEFTWDADGIVIKTVDGGNTWTQILPDGGSMNGIEAVSFPTINTGYIAGWNNYIAKTTDGGETWNNLDVGAEVYFFQDLEFWDENNGVAVGFGGEIYVTNNGGTTWTLATGVNQGVEDIAYASSSVLYAVGGDEKISKSTDGGYSWTEIYSGTFQRYFMGVDFVGDFGVVGGEDGKIMHTQNGGISWSTFATGYHNFQGIQVIDDLTAYVGGTDEDIYKTNDGGNTWEVEYNGSGTSHIYKIKFPGDGIGFACGSQGLILRKNVPLLADFYADMTEVCNGDTIHFYNNSSPTATSWEWTFEGGDPATSTDENPVVVYTDPGSFDVSLSVSDGSDTAEVLKEDFITVENYPAPSIEGNDIVCDFQEEDYSTLFNEGNSYSWEVVGGTIVEGEETNMITVAWGGEGNGMVIVTESNYLFCESTDTLDVLIDDCTLANELNLDNNIQLFPNPVSDQLNIKLEIDLTATYEVTITNYSGQIVESFTRKASTKLSNLSINVGHLTEGIYILQIKPEKESAIKTRFIKK